jgi:hypothetical protein
MNGKTAKLVMGFFVLCALTAWSGVEATGAQDCCNLISQCSQMTDAEILSAAFLGFPGAPTHLGMCYYHDKSTCPNCARDFYVKVSTMPDPSGFDGGTGGLPLGSTLADVARILRELCENGTCCCPQKTPTSDCPALGTTVWARDPLTKTCCQYSNACLAPAGWTTFPSFLECKSETAGVP